MNEKKFDPRKLQKLNNPQRLVDIPPDDIGRRLHRKNPDVVVEIGAGTAFFSVAFFRLFKPATLYACDLSEVMVNYIAENISPEYPDIIPVKTQEQAVPLDDAIADLVFTINLHHELETPLLSLEEAYRIVKPGGQFFVVDWKKEEMPEGPPARIRYLPENVKTQMIKVGFKNVAIYTEMQKHFLVVGSR